MRDIHNILSQIDEISQLNFEQSTYISDLKTHFFQDVDYEVFIQKDKKPLGGRPSVAYYLTVSCLEHLVARKERRVFEVYRQVFHKAMDNASSWSQISTKDKIEAEFIAAKYCGEIRGIVQPHEINNEPYVPTKST